MYEYLNAHVFHFQSPDGDTDPRAQVPGLYIAYSMPLIITASAISGKSATAGNLGFLSFPLLLFQLETTSV